ncbi:class I SAM-dependent methyltransferase [Streptomyces sp. NPDC059009]|uniref:class I SAM-dependent methyltransferase n=1 Tax=Streptomyces sp. NPDC059009 TaxID=3346694 RepID=UPI0036B8931F
MAIEMTAISTVNWDDEAETFDDEPDHGLRAPEIRTAWAARLTSWLPPTSATVLDLGCGTGSLALLAAERGHRVTAVDLAPKMVARAREKFAAAGREAELLVGDAAAPPVPDRTFDVVLARHVLWMLPDPEAAIRHWCTLLRPGGRLILIEGVWGTLSPAGIEAQRVTRALAPLATELRVERLSDDPALWGRAVEDERYAVLGVRASTDGDG